MNAGAPRQKPAWTVRAARPGHADQIVDLLNSVFGDWGDRAYWTWKYQDAPAPFALPSAVAELDGQIVGSVRAYDQESTCYIGRLIVHPNRQNRGLGTDLLQHIEAAFPQAVRFELFTGHLSARNLYLYRKLGYTEFGRQPISDALTMMFLQKLR